MIEILVAVVLIVLNNLGWLYYLDRLNSRTISERYSLLERIMRPAYMPPSPTTKQVDLPDYEDHSPQDLAELAAVGREVEIPRDDK